MRAFVLAGLFLAAAFSGCASVHNVSVSGLFVIPEMEAGDPTPVPMANCAQLLDTLKERALRESRVLLDRDVVTQISHSGRGVMVDDMAAPVGMTMSGSAAPASAASDGGSVHSASSAAPGMPPATGTNNQEQGADEADLVKTDGTWTYVFAHGSLHVLNSKHLGEIEETGRLALSNSWTGGQLLLVPRGPGEGDDRLVVLLSGQGSPTASVQGAVAASAMPPVSRASMTRIAVLSLADRAKPSIETDTWIEGDSIGARLIDGTAYIVLSTREPTLGLRTYAYPNADDLRGLGLDWESYSDLSRADRDDVVKQVAVRVDHHNQDLIGKASLSDHLPLVATGPAGKPAVPPLDDAACHHVLAAPTSTGRGFSTIFAMAVSDQAIPTSTTQVVGTSAILYASDKALVLAAPSQDLWWLDAQAKVEATTDLNWFDVKGLDVTPRASGRAPGLLLDSFSLDVQGDQLRVATTLGTSVQVQSRGTVGAAASLMTQVTLFAPQAGVLVPTGTVTGIAPGERIWSARFTADRAYLVTYPDPVRLIMHDPLWVIDLKSTVPTVLGQLDIPGVSTYIHPVDDKTLLSIGYGPGANNNGLDRNKIEVNLFDISDLTKPTRTSFLDLGPGSGRTWSGAVAEHKAFTYWPEAGLLAVPLTTTESSKDTNGNPLQKTHVGLQLVTLDQGKMALSSRGVVDQDSLAGGDVPWGTQVQRSYFQGFPNVGVASVFSISDLGVTSHDLRTLTMQDSVAFK
ncbi:MAG: beta-propeller domain-containing protein [bacterium]